MIRVRQPMRRRGPGGPPESQPTHTEERPRVRSLPVSSSWPYRILHTDESAMNPARASTERGCVCKDAPAHKANSSSVHRRRLPASAHGTLIIKSPSHEFGTTKSAVSLVTVSASVSLPQLTMSLPPSPETVMVSPPLEPFTTLESELPVRSSAPDPPTTLSMNAELVVSQVTVFVPSVAVPVPRFTVTLALALPQAKQRSSSSA